LELDLPRSIREMLVVAFELYRRVPGLFLVFAAILVVPYEVIVLVITGKGPFALGQIAFIPRQLIVVIESFLVTPLVSALHIHAVREVGDGGRPRLLPTLRARSRSSPAPFWSSRACSCWRSGRSSRRRRRSRAGVGSAPYGEAPS
jgi:hypothetical protein